MRSSNFSQNVLKLYVSSGEIGIICLFSDFFEIRIIQLFSNSEIRIIQLFFKISEIGIIWLFSEAKLFSTASTVNQLVVGNHLPTLVREVETLLNKPNKEIDAFLIPMCIVESMKTALLKSHPFCHMLRDQVRAPHSIFWISFSAISIYYLHRFPFIPLFGNT